MAATSNTTGDPVKVFELRRRDDGDWIAVRQHEEAHCNILPGPDPLEQLTTSESDNDEWVDVDKEEDATSSNDDSNNGNEALYSADDDQESCEDPSTDLGQHETKVPCPVCSSNHQIIQVGEDINLFDEINKWRWMSPRKRIGQKPSYLHHRHCAHFPRYTPRPRQEAAGDDLSTVELEPPTVAERVEIRREDVLYPEWKMYWDTLYTVLVSTCSHAISLTVIFLGTFFFSTSQQQQQQPDKRTVVIYSFAFAAILVGFSFLRQPNFLQITYGSKILNCDKQSFQLLAYATISDSLVLLRYFKILEPVKELTPLLLQEATLNYKLILKWFLFNFVFLFTIDIPLSIKRMVNSNNPVFRQILSFELAAHLVPMAYLTCLVLGLNLISHAIPPERQTLWIWVPLYIVAFLWLEFIFLAVIRYPEIEVCREQDFQGWLYMCYVSRLQFDLARCLCELLWLLLFLYRGEEALGKRRLGNDVSNQLNTYLLQLIYRDEPPSEWTFRYPFPISIDMFLFMYYFVNLARMLHLFLKTGQIRPENGDRVDNQMD